MNEKGLFLEEIKERIRLNNSKACIFPDPEENAMYMASENDALIDRPLDIYIYEENGEKKINTIDRGVITLKTVKTDQLVKSETNGEIIGYKKDNGDTIENEGYNPFKNTGQELNRIFHDSSISDNKSLIHVVHKIAMTIGNYAAGPNDINKISSMSELSISLGNSDYNKIYPLYIETSVIDNLKNAIDVIFEEFIDPNDLNKYSTRQELIDDVRQYIDLPPELYYPDEPEFKNGAELAPKKATESIAQYETRQKEYYEKNKDVSNSTDFQEIVSTIAKLNPNVEIKIENDEALANNNKTIYTDGDVSTLKLPKGFSYNEKNGITNKHNTENGSYINISVGKPSTAPNPNNLKNVEPATKLDLDDAAFIVREGYPHEKIDYPKNETTTSNYEAPYLRRLRTIKMPKTNTETFIEPEKIGILDRLKATGKAVKEGINNIIDGANMQKTLKAILLAAAAGLIIVNIPNIIAIVPILCQAVGMVPAAIAHLIAGTSTIAENELVFATLLLLTPVVITIISKIKNKLKKEQVIMDGDGEELEENTPTPQIEQGSQTPEQPVAPSDPLTESINRNNKAQIITEIKNYLDNIASARQQINNLSIQLDIATDTDSVKKVQAELRNQSQILNSNLSDLLALMKKYNINLNDYTRGNENEQGRSLA